MVVVVVASAASVVARRASFKQQLRPQNRTVALQDVACKGGGATSMKYGKQLKINSYGPWMDKYLVSSGGRAQRCSACHVERPTYASNISSSVPGACTYV